MIKLFLLGMSSVAASAFFRQFYQWYKKRTTLQAITQNNLHQNNELKDIDQIRLASHPVNDQLSDNEVILFKNESQQVVITFLKNASIIRLTAPPGLSQLLSDIEFDEGSLDRYPFAYMNVYELVLQNFYADLLKLYYLPKNALHIQHYPIRLASHQNQNQMTQNEITLFKNEHQQLNIAFLKKPSQDETAFIEYLIAPPEVSKLLSGINFDDSILNKTQYPFAYESLYRLVSLKSGYTIEHSHYLGEGGFGEVFKGSWKDKTVALKIVDIYRGQSRQRMPSDAMKDATWEITRLSSVSHPHVVQFYGLYTENNRLYLAMEYCEKGSLKNALPSLESVISAPSFWPRRWQWMLEIAQALAYLHHQGIIHQDLKPDNVLIDARQRARLIDLGIAQVDTLLQQNIGPHGYTHFYRAPESSDTISTFEIDIYVLGIVFWQMITGQDAAIFWEKKEKEKAIPNGCPAEMRTLLLDCWQLNPADRPTAEVLVKQLQAMGKRFNQKAIEWQLCYEADIDIHPYRKESLKYLSPYLTEHPVLEDLDTYWQHLEVIPNFDTQLAQKEKAIFQDISNPPSNIQDAFQDFLDQTEINALVLLGDSGLGKTLSTYQLADGLLQPWWEYLNNSANTATEIRYYPLCIRSQVKTWTHSALQNAIGEFFKKYKGSENLLKDIRWLVMVDGYDECVQDVPVQNLPQWLGLDQLPRAKLLVTCRPNTVAAQALTERFGINHRLMVRYFLPFHVTQMLNYLQSSLEWTDEIRQANQDIIQKTPSLRQILRNPFVLSLLVQSWETTLAQKPLEALTRWEIYEGFTAHWLKTRQFLLLASIQTVLSQHHSGDLLDSFNAFAAEIAFESFKQKNIAFNTATNTATLSAHTNQWLELIQQVKEHSSATFAGRAQQGADRKNLLSESDYVQIMIQRLKQFESSSPLKRKTTGFDFAHKSFFEYFAARRIIDLQKQNSTTIMEEGLALLNNRSLQEEPEMLHFMVEGWRESGRDALKEAFFEIVNKSKNNEQVAQAASNAITILNRARVSFSGIDLSNIRIPGADLTGAILDNTNFENADLRNVLFARAWLHNTSFIHAHMSGVQLGEYPHFLFKEWVKSCCYSHNGRWLVIATGKEAHLYDASTRDLVYTFKDHISDIVGVCFSSDDQLLATGSEDRTAKIWFVETGGLHKTLEDTNCITSVALSPDGQFLATGSTTTKLWQVKTGSLYKVLEHNTTSVAFSPDGQLLATGSRDTTAKLWWVKIGVLHKTLEGHRHNVECIAFNPNGKLLATASWDYTAKLWGVETGILYKTLKGHTKFVRAVAFSPDGLLLATGSYDNTVKLWQVETGILHQTLEGHTSWVWTVSFNPNGQSLATGSHDKTTKLLKVETSDLQKTLEGHHTHQVTCVALSFDGGLLASASRDKTVKLWDTTKNRLQKTFVGHTDFVTSVALSFNGRFLATGSKDKTVKLWQVETGVLYKTLEGHSNPLAFSFDSQFLATISSFPITTILWQIETETGLLLHKTLENQNGSIMSIVFSPNNQLVATAGWGKKIELWWVETGLLNKTLEGHEGTVSSVGFSPDGQLLASGSYDKTVKLWQVKTGVLYKNLEGHTNWVESVAFSPNGQCLVTASRDNTLQLWQHFCTSEVDVLIISITSRTSAIIFSQNSHGIFLGSGHEDHSVRYWQLFQKNKKPYLQLLWTSHQNALLSQDACIEGVQGLSKDNMDLLLQRGAIGKPLMLSDSGKIAFGSHSNASSSSNSQSNNNSQRQNEAQWVAKNSGSNSSDYELGKHKKDCKIM